MKAKELEKLMDKLGTDEKKIAKEGQKLNVISKYRKNASTDGREGYVFIFAEHDPIPYEDAKTPNITKWVEAESVPYSNDVWYFDSDGDGGLQANARPQSEYDVEVKRQGARLEAMKQANIDVNALIGALFSG